MKKRIFLFMLVGLSFAPPVIADEVLGGRKIEDRKTGESTSQISSLGINCSFARQDKAIADDVVSPSKGSAAGAGIAK